MKKCITVHLNELCAIKNIPLWMVIIHLLRTEKLSGFVEKKFTEYNIYAIDLKQNIFSTWKYVNGEELLNIYRSIITKKNHSYKLELRANNENVFIFF